MARRAPTPVVPLALAALLAIMEIPLSVVAGLVGAPMFPLPMGRRRYRFSGGGA